ncbi:hypothetical protein [Pedobacter insulae]|uniref:hypothetical protein n=1 Tax=Pedobacter insulae TaxID=414048 RepID=UPI0015A69C31|nr:hypothetical protein [Pedobacter insulae]
MESQQSTSQSREKQSVVKISIQDQANFSHGELSLTAEKPTLVEEIKILIRKLWN